MFDIIDLNAARSALKQDSTRVLDERQGSQQNHNRDAHARTGIGVEPGWIMGLPDDHGGNDDADVVDSISDDVDQNTKHTEITAGLLKLSQVVTMLCVGWN